MRGETLRIPTGGQICIGSHHAAKLQFQRGEEGVDRVRVRVRTKEPQGASAGKVGPNVLGIGHDGLQVLLPLPTALAGLLLDSLRRQIQRYATLGSRPIAGIGVSRHVQLSAVSQRALGQHRFDVLLGQNVIESGLVVLWCCLTSTAAIVAVLGGKGYSGLGNQEGFLLPVSAIEFVGGHPRGGEEGFEQHPRSTCGGEILQDATRVHRDAILLGGMFIVIGIGRIFRKENLGWRQILGQ